jgi:hypothetical protein
MENPIRKKPQEAIVEVLSELSKGFDYVLPISFFIIVSMLVIKVIKKIIEVTEEVNEMKEKTEEKCNLNSIKYCIYGDEGNICDSNCGAYNTICTFTAG